MNFVPAKQWCSLSRYRGRGDIDDQPLAMIDAALGQLETRAIWATLLYEHFSRANGSFAPYFRVGRRVYCRRSTLEAWIAKQEQEQVGGDDRG